jgi:hypothetical protein
LKGTATTVPFVFPRKRDCSVQENENILWFSVSDLEKAKQVDCEVLGFDVSDADGLVAGHRIVGHIAELVRKRLGSPSHTTYDKVPPPLHPTDLDGRRM